MYYFEQIDSLVKELEKCFGKNPIESKDKSRIVSSYHFGRLVKLIDEDEVSNKIVYGGQRDESQLWVYTYTSLFIYLNIYTYIYIYTIYMYMYAYVYFLMMMSWQHLQADSTNHRIESPWRLRDDERRDIWANYAHSHGGWLIIMKD